MTDTTLTTKLQVQLQITTDQTQRTELIAQWLYKQTDEVKLCFAINASIPHSWFNVMCNYLPSAEIQNIDWFSLLKNKANLIVWARDMEAPLI
jgi:hypothetical protein